MRQHCGGPLIIGLATLILLEAASNVYGACCYFSAKDKDVEQPSQKVFITWDPAKKSESFTVQPRFEGNALDFGMVIPTPTQPKLHEMPRDFFKSLAVYTILKRRDFPTSKLLPLLPPTAGFGMGMYGGMGMMGGGMGMMGMGYGGGTGGMPGMGGFGYGVKPPPPPVKVIETGLVGSLDYKILEATRADELHQWLKDNKYHYAGDEATLDFYVQKKWYFTVMKIDTMQMKKDKDGSYLGDVTPTRFSFSSDKLIYPLKITQISVKDKTEALFYVQAPTKVDLPGDMSYQHTWVPMLQAASGCTPGGLPGYGGDWLAAINNQIPNLLQKNQALDFNFQPGQRPLPNKKGRIPTTMEWARKLTAKDVALLQGKAPYSEAIPNVDAGFNAADILDPKRGASVAKVINYRLGQLQKSHPIGYLVRHVPADQVEQLRLLLGHLQAGTFITKFRKTFTRDEMNDDLLIIPARLGQEEDNSEYEEMLPTSPP
jgi:hypothetical protein